MNEVLLVRGAKQLLSLRGPSGARRGPALRDIGLIQDGAMLSHQGRILAVGPARRIENLAVARNAEEISAAGGVVMPGFVDSHTHLVFGPPRLADYEMRIHGATYPEIAEAGGGILSSVKAVRSLSRRHLASRARTFLQAMARHGTTTLEAKSGYGLNATAELKTLRVLAALNENPLDIVSTYLGAHVTPPEFDGRPREYIDWIGSELMPIIRRRKLASFADIYCEPGTFDLDLARCYLIRAQELGFMLKIHAEQFTRSGGARLAVELKAVSADHLDQISDEDVDLLSASGTIAALLPGAVFHLGLDRYPPARQLIDRGAAVALASDFNPGTSPTCNMQIILSLACSQMRMTPAEAISAATINGAHAIRMADRVGSLEPGKQADFIVMKVSDYREIPYHFGMNHVRMTFKRGVSIYQEGAAESWPER